LTHVCPHATLNVLPTLLFDLQHMTNEQPARTTNQFRYLAQLRLAESYVLLKNNKWHGAMYIAGYVLECALKAVIAKREGGRLPVEYQVHDIEVLRQAASAGMSTSDAAILSGVPHWTHLQRYHCAAPKAVTVVRFIECIQEAHKCLQSYF
jgi:hypothetical protein